MIRRRAGLQTRVSTARTIAAATRYVRRRRPSMRIPHLRRLRLQGKPLRSWTTRSTRSGGRAALRRARLGPRRVAGRHRWRRAAGRGDASDRELAPRVDCGGSRGRRRRGACAAPRRRGTSGRGRGFGPSGSFYPLAGAAEGRRIGRASALGRRRRAGDDGPSERTILRATGRRAMREGVDSTTLDQDRGVPQDRAYEGLSDRRAVARPPRRRTPPARLGAVSLDEQVDLDDVGARLWPRQGDHRRARTAKVRRCSSHQLRSRRRGACSWPARRPSRSMFPAIWSPIALLQNPEPVAHDEPPLFVVRMAIDAARMLLHNGAAPSIGRRSTTRLSSCRPALASRCGRRA